jgi:hypothetical protein
LRRLDPLEQALSGSKPTILEVTEGDGDELLGIYAIRTEIAAEKGKSVENYRDLLSNMQRERSKRIAVLHVGTHEEVFLVFTDRESKKILGVIPGVRPVLTKDGA